MAAGLTVPLVFCAALLICFKSMTNNSLGVMSSIVRPLSVISSVALANFFPPDRKLINGFSGVASSGVLAKRARTLSSLFALAATIAASSEAWLAGSGAAGAAGAGLLPPTAFARAAPSFAD